MDGLFYLFGVLAIVVIVHWVVRNDKSGADGTMTGLLAMRDQTAAGVPPVRARTGWQDSLTAPPGRRAR